MCKIIMSIYSFDSGAVGLDWKVVYKYFCIVDTAFTDNLPCLMQ